MAGTLSTLSIISFVVAAVALAIAVVLWFFLEIPTVIGDLSGRTARKSIAKMRAENEKTVQKKNKESKAITKKEKPSNDDRLETGLLVENRAETAGNEETGLLNNEETGLLDSEETGLLIDENETASLESSIQVKKRTGGKTLTIIEEIMLVHTDEIIE